MEGHAPTLPCRICGSTAPLFDVCDFANHCFRPATGPAELSGIAVYYYRCRDCGLLFSPLTDGWTTEDFRARIYTDDYAAFDPEIDDERPSANAALVEKLFGDHRSSLSLLDFGGGDGALARMLKQKGFANARSCDPIRHPDESPPQGRFDLVTCFEVLEHANDPLAMVRDLADLTGPDGMVLFSTLLQPPDIDVQRLRWWYAAPRNGHVSLYTAAALAAAWKAAGMNCASFGNSLHVAFRQPPSFAARLFRGEPV